MSRSIRLYQRKAIAFLSPLSISTRRSFLRTALVSRVHCAEALSRLDHVKPLTRCTLSLSTVLKPSVAASLSAAGSISTPFALWAVLLGAATYGMISQRYRWGRALTPPLVTTLFTLILSNFGLLPTIHPIYTSVTSFIVPLSVPLILLGADLRRVIAQTGRLLPVFVAGTIATCLGTLGAWFLVPMKSLGPAAWKIAAALTARHIGGAVNYVAVADATAAPSDIVTAALTADNVVVALYFVLLLLLARNVAQPPVFSPETEAKDAPMTAVVDDNGDSEQTSGPVSIQDAGISLTLSAVLCTMAAFVSALLPVKMGVIPVVTLFVVALATAFPKQLTPYRTAASTIGIFLLQVFFAVAGAGGSLIAVLRRAPVLVIFSTVQLLIHLAFLLFTARLFRFDRANVLLASNANVSLVTFLAILLKNNSLV